MASEIRVNTINNSSGLGTITISDTGAFFSGITTISDLRITGTSNAGVTTVSAGSASVPSISPSGDTDTGIFFPAADTIGFAEGGAEAARIDSSGRLLIGTTSARSNYLNSSSFSGLLQIEGTNNSTRIVSFVHNTSGAEQPLLVLGKSRGTTAGSNTVVQSGDNLGILSFHGADGSELVEAARVEAVVDSTPGANDMPGRLVFSTTADGASSVTERMRIDSSGRVTMYGGNLHLSGSGTQSILVGSTNAGGAQIALDGDANGDGAGGDYAYIIHNTDGDLDLVNLKSGVITFSGTSDSEKARIDSSGRLLVGTSTARSNFVTGTLASTIQVESGGTSWYSAVKSSNDQFGPFYILGKTRSTTNNGNTVVQNGDELGTLLWQGADGSTLIQGASIAAVVDGTPGTNDLPTRITFSTTPDGAAGPTERMRIRADGTTVTTGTTILFGGNAATAGTPRSLAFGSNEIAWTAGGSGGTNLFLNACDAAGNNGSSYNMFFRGLASGGAAGAVINNFEVQSSLFVATGAYSSTTTNGANVVVQSNGRLLRSTSSARYKTNIETLEDSYADALLSCRPVWYQSTSTIDSELHPDWGYWGFIAEEVAEIDPRLVSWKTHEETTALDGTKTVEELTEPVPEGVQYDRFVPHLLNLIKRQKEQIESQATQLASFEARLTALEGQ